MMLSNIALTGKLRSGKSTVADYLSSKYGYTQFAFGDALKDDFHRRYPEIPRTPKPRVGYQSHGQLMRELVAKDVWVTRCFDDIYAAQRYPAVITDLRQPNEFDRCRAEGYVIVRVNATEGVRVDRAVKSSDTFNYADLRHDTESHVDTFSVDYDVYNVGTPDELYAQIDAIMAAITEVGV